MDIDLVVVSVFNKKNIITLTEVDGGKPRYTLYVTPSAVSGLCELAFRAYPKSEGI